MRNTDHLSNDGLTDDERYTLAESYMDGPGAGLTTTGKTALNAYRMHQERGPIWSCDPKGSQDDD